MTVHVFTGPTLAAEEVTEIVPEAVVRPPVAHGDLLRGDLGPGDTAVIIDGFYHQQAPVRHKEILELLGAGTHVVGCSSMGALRAAELHPCGMVGHGAVFEMYRDGVIDADDEVAVTHGRAGSLATRNTPLVAVRYAVARAAEAGVLTAEQARVVVAACRSLHYTDRSWFAVRHLLRAQHPEHADTLDHLLAHLEANPSDASVKHSDAVDTLRHLARLTSGPAAVVSTHPWRNRHLLQWVVQHRGAPRHGRLVTDDAVLADVRVHQPDFPATWADFVGSRLRADLPDRTGASRATGATGATGACAESDWDRVVEHWRPRLRLAERADHPYLTATEAACLDEREAVRLTLVRYFTSPRGDAELLDHRPGLVRDPAARDAVARAEELNATATWRGREMLVDRLPRPLLQRHLASLWGRPNTVEEVTAAARDRGFRSLEHALIAARRTFLRDDQDAGGRAGTRGKAS
jgi:hypothetical protein